METVHMGSVHVKTVLMVWMIAVQLAVRMETVRLAVHMETVLMVRMIAVRLAVHMETVRLTVHMETVHMETV